MLPSTLEIIKTTLKNDKTLSAVEYKRFITMLRFGRNETSQANTKPTEKRILRRHEVARRMSVGMRTVDKWAKEGIIRKMKLPGRKRACGFLSSEIDTLMMENISTDES